MNRLLVDIEFQFKSGFELSAKLVADAGEITRMFGPSGSGKSTVLSLIAGITTPASGSIKLGSRILYSSDSSINVKPWHRDVGLVFQKHTLFPHLSVRKNLNYAASKRPDSPWQFESIIEQFDIAGLLDRKPSQLSGGQRDRVALGRTLLSQPEILLLDEPLNSVEGSLRDSILDFVLQGISQLGIPALLVSHDSSLQSNPGGSVYEIEDGVLQEAGSNTRDADQALQ